MTACASRISWTDFQVEVSDGSRVDTYTEDVITVDRCAMYKKKGGPSPKGTKVVGDGGMKGRRKVVRHRPLRGHRN